MFSKKEKPKDTETFSANEFIDLDAITPNKEEVETELSVPSDWNLTNEERYVYAFHNNESPKLKVNQISIYGMELVKGKNGLDATGLIRNTVPKNIKFGPTTILLLGANKEVVAKKEFDLAKLGDIPANGARPWKFSFSDKDIINNVEIPVSNWSLAFEIKKKHQLDLEESWEKSIAGDTKANLEKIIANATPLKPGEVNFMGLNAKRNENKDLVVAILIRNGSEKNITLKQVPLGVKDASNEEIARGSFKLENFIIKANTSKPWTFIFPSAVIKKDDLDLSKWQAYPLKQNA